MSLLYCVNLLKHEARWVLECDNVPRNTVQCTESRVQQCTVQCSVMYYCTLDKAVQCNNVQCSLMKKNIAQLRAVKYRTVGGSNTTWIDSIQGLQIQC